MSTLNLKEAWLSLPDAAQEPVVGKILMPALIRALGYLDDECYPEFKTGKGGDKVDFAIRCSKGYEDSFLIAPKNPYVLIEIKGRDINLEQGTSYKKTVNQIRKYLHSSAKHSRSAKWGIITNGDNIQLFRRHGLVVYPYTQNLKLTADNIQQRIALIKYYLENEEKALSIAVYNNKGGVGKTTTVINLAGILSLPIGKRENPLGFAKKVLVVDFDPNQKDLTDLLEVKPNNVTLSKFIQDHKNNNIKDVISRYRLLTKSGKEYGFDILPVDDDLHSGQNEYIKYLNRSFLRKALTEVKNDYDYILIDSPPGRNLFTEEAIAASDVVLMPSKHNGIASFKNAAVAMTTMFPDLGEARRDAEFENTHDSIRYLGDPIPLPIFFNGESITPTQKEQAQKAILSIVKAARKEEQIDLMKFFFPKYTNSRKNLDIFVMPSYAHIASAAFSSRPAVFTSKKAREYYRNLVREYFI
ncbi:ParA family protein [[Limnothrix rosea] IAM M-220]|uniref:ParA family protein n=1 Tax=[Limnothrix rosea] IAM M-220 TaxID=454133 RepID=UPI000963E59E|nr:ParA family protein [[Limnothrix rosea] IAM M-220]OKH16959.1 ATPase [[Limnothrix rosea] IAM M-220]